jgi:putative PIN family toxin of toxin-antitoxin system
MRIVFDTNCLLQVLPQKSQYRCLWDAFLSDGYELCYTTDILQEYDEILSCFYRLKVAEATIGTLVKSKSSIQIIPYFKWNLISADPADNKFVDCALNAGADFIVTSDRHFNILNNIAFPPIKVINIETFKSILKT